MKYIKKEAKHIFRPNERVFVALTIDEGDNRLIAMPCVVREVLEDSLMVECLSIDSKPFEVPMDERLLSLTYNESVEICERYNSLME